MEVENLKKLAMLLLRRLTLKSVCLDGEPSSVGPTVSPGGVLDLAGEQPRGR
jgi:hypothetical protein